MFGTPNSRKTVDAFPKDATVLLYWRYSIQLQNFFPRILVENIPILSKATFCIFYINGTNFKMS